MKKNIILFCSFLFSLKSNTPDVTLIGRMMQADGLIRFSIGIIDHLHKDMKINFIPAGKVDFFQVPSHVKDIALNKDKRSGNISLLLDHPWNAYDNYLVNLVPKDSKIKLAYSMFETTKIPEKWVEIFNSQFDAIVVPDEFLVEIYKKNGVTKPIFVLPLGLYLNDFLNKPTPNLNSKFKKDKPFIFGVSSSAWQRKNTDMLIEAFAKEFGNSKKVQLHIHSRPGGSEKAQAIIKSKINKYKLKNLYFKQSYLTHEQYIKFLMKLDCYVLLSKGEGYSVSPRESMALGVPCILTNNTGHRSLCNSGLVKVVKSNILEPAQDYFGHFKDRCGYVFNCKLSDARKAMREVYNNYDLYLKKAGKSREWVKQYSYDRLKPKYVGLLKPDKVILSNRNYIGDYYIETDSLELYNKYLTLK